jgi:antitoxin (DNA-binding transcriptional repressor) of toxin-antitoxin stability system
VANSWPLKKSHNCVVPKNVIHVSEAEAASDFAALLERVRAGAEVVIEKDSRPVAILRPFEESRGLLLSEMLARAEARGSTATLDGDFGRDVEDGINSHREPLKPH